MSKRDQWLRRLQRRLQLGLFTKWLVRYLAISLFIAGILILSLKLLVPEIWPHNLWAFLLVIPAIGLGWIRSVRETYSQQDSVAFLDSQIGAGGLLMSIDESPDSFWESRLPELDKIWKNSLPRWKFSRVLRAEAAPVAFVLAACLIPDRILEPMRLERPEVAQREIEQLRESLKSLEQQDWISQEDEQELEEEIRKLADETRLQTLTHETWETVDALKQRMQQIVGSNQMQMAKAQGALSRLQDAIDSGKALTEERLSEIAAEISDALQKGGLQNPLSEDVIKKLKENMKDGKFNSAKSQEDLQRAMDELRDYIENQTQSLGEAKGDIHGQPRFDGDFDWNEGEDDGSGRPPGAGGIGRGRGDAPMGWGDEADEQGFKFRDSLLPEGVNDPSDDVIKTKLTEPDAEPVAPTGRSAPRTNKNATGKNAWKRQLRPRHRDVIRKYFDEKE